MKLTNTSGQIQTAQNQIREARVLQIRPRGKTMQRNGSNHLGKKKINQGKSLRRSRRKGLRVRMMKNWESCWHSKCFYKMANVTPVCLCSDITSGKMERLTASSMLTARSHSAKGTQVNWRKWRASIIRLRITDLEKYSQKYPPSQKLLQQDKKTFLMLKYVGWCPRKILEDPLARVYQRGKQ